MPNFNSFLHQEEHVFPQKLVIRKRKSSHGLLPREERPLENASRFDSVNRQSTLQISSFSMKTEGKNSVELTQLFTCQLTCYTHETFQQAPVQEVVPCNKRDAQSGKDSEASEGKCALGTQQ